ncbi:MAG TPA: hypothetical protein V6D14_14980 [Coleofasciculaceae cyanobacterium]
MGEDAITLEGMAGEIKLGVESADGRWEVIEEAIAFSIALPGYYLLDGAHDSSMVSHKSRRHSNSDKPFSSYRTMRRSPSTALLT